MTYGAALPAQRAHADLPALSWSAPANCPDSSAVRQRIAAWLHKPELADAPDGAVRATGVVTRSRGGYKLTLTVTEAGVSGTRSLFGKDCRQLSDTAAFLIAVSSDPNAAASEPPAAGAPEPPAVPEAKLAPAPPSAEATPATPTPPTSQAARRDDGPWSVHGSGFGGLWQSKLPGLQALAGGSVGGAYGIWQAELRGAFAFPREAQIQRTGGRVPGIARASTQSYGLAVCALWSVGARLRGGPCASLSLLNTQASTDGVEKRGTAYKLWSVVGLGAQASVELVRHFELFGEGGATVPVYDRPVFTLDDTQVLRAAKGAYYGWLGARIRWGISSRAKP